MNTRFCEYFPCTISDAWSLALMLKNIIALNPLMFPYHKQLEYNV